MRTPSRVPGPEEGGVVGEGDTRVFRRCRARESRGFLGTLLKTPPDKKTSVFISPFLGPHLEMPSEMVQKAYEMGVAITLEMLFQGGGWHRLIFRIAFRMGLAMVLRCF